MEHSWRWYGPNDPVSLSDIEQAGAVSIVTALHHIPNGEVWTVEEIEKRKSEILFDEKSNRKRNLFWSVVESVPVHNDIKTRSGNYQTYIENYKQSLENLSTCGIKTVCYNFMPLLDWTRTSLSMDMPDGGKALAFDMVNMAVFDLFILERENAINNYTQEVVEQAKKRFPELSDEEKDTLSKCIIMGLPGAEESFTVEKLKAELDNYKDIDAKKLKEHLLSFLGEIIPVAEKLGITMVIHPDDPPFPVLGLPRILSTEKDLGSLLSSVDSPSNGFTFCAGSYGVREDNDLPQMIKKFGDRMKFIHLRNVKSDAIGNFHESQHLDGNADMYEIVKEILTWEKELGIEIPMRPDHGHQILDDLSKQTNPGYSGIGRLKGLAELRGLELGIKKAVIDNS